MRYDWYDCYLFFFQVGFNYHASSTFAIPAVGTSSDVAPGAFHHHHHVQSRKKSMVAREGFELDLDRDGTAGTPSDELQAEASIWAFELWHFDTPLCLS
jgi:hypothetical protein